jgi:signal peptidase I
VTQATRWGRLSAVSAALGVAAIAVLLPLAAFLLAAWLFGLQLLTVETGSMAPTFPVGALLVSGQVDPADVHVGMAIVFEDPAKAGRLISHRVIGVTGADSLAFWTQGDANNVRDPVPVPARMVRARVLWQVPILGAATEWLQWPRSFILLVVVPAGLLLLLEWRHRRRHEPAAGARAPATA